jgi:PadR family transcriptional regulator, regulatory protein PadR
MSRVSKDLVAASSRMIILSLLCREKNYGYQILQSIKLLTEGGWSWKDGMLYPVLHKMEQEKLITSHWEVSPTGLKRKYYEIAEKGLMELQKEKEEWHFVHATLHKLWDMQAC